MGNSKISISSKTAHCRGNLGLNLYAACMLVFFTLAMSRSFGVIRCTFPKLGCNSKVAHRKAKRTKIWGLGIACILVFWPWTCQGHLGSLGAVFRKLCSNSKVAHHKVKRTKIWALGMYVACILVYLTLNMSSSFWVIGCTFPKIGP